MTIRKNALGLMALAIALLFSLAACDISVWVWDPPPTEPDPEPEPEPGLTFSLEWTDSGIADPHLYVTYPAPSDGETTDDLGTPTFVDPYLPPTDGGDLGFDPIDILEGYPNEYTDDRGTVYFGNTQSAYTILGRPAVEMLEIDDAAEVTFVRGFPFTSYSSVVSTTGGGTTGLVPGSYTWVGVMEVYAYATSGQLEYASGAGVNAVLNVFEDGDPLAVYELPATTDLKGSTIVRINCFYDAAGFEIYQLVPDIRVIQSTTQIRSVAPGATIDDESGIITVRRPAGS